MTEGTKVFVGLRGFSAADVARQQGFDGDDTAWVESLEQGARDQTALAEEAAVRADTRASDSTQKAAEAELSRSLAEAAAARAQAPTDEMNETLIKNPESKMAKALSGAIDASVNPGLDALRWFKFRLGQIDTSPVNILGIGDSTMEGARASVRSDRWLEKVLAILRTKYQPVGVPGGVGYTPIKYLGGVPFGGAVWSYANGADPGTILLSDSFGGSGDLHNRVTETGGGTWNASPAGTYTVSGGNALNASSAGGMGYINGVAAVDREVIVNFKLGTLDATVRAIRFFPVATADVSSRIEIVGNVTASGSAFSIEKQIAGVKTTLETGWEPLASPSGLEVTMAGKLDGTTLTVTVNGSVKSYTLSAGDAAALRGTAVGFQNVGTGGQWHDVTIKATSNSESLANPTLRLTHGLGLRAVELGVDCTSATTTFKGTGVDVVFTKRSAGGSLRVSVDGGAATTVSTNGGSESGGNTYRVAGLTGGTHTLKLSSQTSALVEGIVVYDGDESRGLRLYEGAHFGYSSRNFVAVPAWAASLTNLPAPDLAFVALGLNDYAAQTITPTELKSNLEFIIGSIRARNSQCSVVIINSFERGDVVSPNHLWQSYVDAMNEVAAADDKAMIVDLNSQLLGWNRVPSSMRFLWNSDKVHYEPAGYTTVANMVTEALVRA